MKNSWLGTASVLAAATAFALASIVIKYCYWSGMDPVTVTVLFNVLSAAMAWVWVLSARTSPAVPRRLLPAMAAQGAIGSFLTTFLFYVAIDLLGAGLATLIIFSYPAFVIAYSLFARCAAVTKVQFLALILALAGIVLSLDITDPSMTVADFRGMLFAIGAAISNAFLVINGEKLVSQMKTSAITAWSLTFSVAMMFLVFRPVWLAELSLSWHQAGLVVSGAFLTVIPIVLYLVGVKNIGAGGTSIISTAEIPIALLLAWLLLNESLGPMQLIGSILIASSVLLIYCFSSSTN